MTIEEAQAKFGGDIHEHDGIRILRYRLPFSARTLTITEEMLEDIALIYGDGSSPPKGVIIGKTAAQDQLKPGEEFPGPARVVYAR